MCRTYPIAVNLATLKRYLRPGTTVSKWEIVNLYRQNSRNKKNIQLLTQTPFAELLYTESGEMILL